LVTPVLLLSAALSCVAAAVNLQIAPQCRVAYKNLFFRVSLERGHTLIVEDRFMDDFPGYIVYVGKKRDTNLQEVLIYELNPEGKMKGWIRAGRAGIAPDLTNNQVQIRLYKVQKYDLEQNTLDYADETQKTLAYKPPTTPTFSVPLSDMTFLQL